MTAQIRTGISKEDARHLWYASYVNDFAIGYVEWQYGELTILHGSREQPVHLSLTRQEWRTEGVSSRRNGSPLQGADPSIGRSGQSRPFRYQPQSKLRFYRLWHAVNTSTESIKPQLYELLGQKSWADVRWTVSPGMISDTMEVALWLVDADTDERLALLDSVGVMGSTMDALARRYGSAPDECVRTVSLPDRFSGRNVRVQPLPYRYGATPFGLMFLKRFSTFNMSALFEHESRFVFPSSPPPSEDPAFSLMIDSVYGQELRDFYAQGYQDDSCPPSLLCLYALDVWHQDALNAFLKSVRFRRNDPECMARAAADTAWWVATLDEAPPTVNSAQEMAQLPARPELLVSRLSDDGCVATLLNITSEHCSFTVSTDLGIPIGAGSAGSAPFTDRILPFTTRGIQPAFLVVTLADGTVLRARFDEMSTPPESPR